MSQQSDMIAEVAAAQIKHLKWRSHLAAAIAQGRSEFTPEKAGCDKSCDFGRWFHGAAIPPDLKAGKGWQAIDAAHAAFHATAAQVLGLALAGRADEARTMMGGAFAERADRVLKALSLWKLDLATGRAQP
ncbi:MULTISPECIES: CZB domain-containing protein [Rhodovulum]|uniref:Chemoreceptor zinc-binding protein n=2 Tax=Rhodovulum TaxID=34008 RepID=A0A8E2VNX6_9RHOB|nr:MULTISPECIES: CZB domain-containing protein [Rhodovulum]PTW51968.1 chemoreceptor zinc-binding protein [Rhodovulum kholense]RAP40183.1 hypothetical protein BYZ73_16730 [Rhodovulum viride]